MNKRIIALVLTTCLLSAKTTHGANENLTWWKYGAAASGITGIIGTSILGYSLYKLYDNADRQAEDEIRALVAQESGHKTEIVSSLQETSKQDRAVRFYKKLAYLGAALDLVSICGLGVCLYRIYTAPTNESPQEYIIPEPSPHLDDNFIQSVRADIERWRREVQNRPPPPPIQSLKHNRQTQTQTDTTPPANPAPVYDHGVIPAPPQEILQGATMSIVPKHLRKNVSKRIYFLSLANLARNELIRPNMKDLKRAMIHNITKAPDRTSESSRYLHHRRMLSMAVEDLGAMRADWNRRQISDEEIHNILRNKEREAEILLSQADHYLFVYKEDPYKAFSENPSNFFPAELNSQQIAASINEARNPNNSSVITQPNYFGGKNARRTGAR